MYETDRPYGPTPAINPVVLLADTFGGDYSILVRVTVAATGGGSCALEVANPNQAFTTIDTHSLVGSNDDFTLAGTVTGFIAGAHIRVECFTNAPITADYWAGVKIFESVDASVLHLAPSQG